MHGLWPLPPFFFAVLLHICQRGVKRAGFNFSANTGLIARLEVENEAPAFVSVQDSVAPVVRPLPVEVPFCKGGDALDTFGSVSSVEVIIYSIDHLTWAHSVSDVGVDAVKPSPLGRLTEIPTESLFSVVFAPVSRVLLMPRSVQTCMCWRRCKQETTSNNRSGKRCNPTDISDVLFLCVSHNVVGCTNRSMWRLSKSYSRSFSQD